MLRRLRWTVSILIAASGVLSAALPYESRVQAIDRQVLAVDQALDRFIKTSDDVCEEGTCTRTAEYWGEKGRLTKSVTEVRPEEGRGAVTARYYENCQVYFVRVTPNDTEEVKNRHRIEKFYFKKGKLLRVMFGDETQAFGADQMGFYQRTLPLPPKKCFQNVK